MRKINIKRVISAMAILIVMALSCLNLSAGANNNPHPVRVDTSSKPTLTVSLITCYPGPEIYELYGHEAIRVRGEGIDSIWNYGVFDFNAPNFVYRFVKGETDYMCVGYPFEYFLPPYIARNSKVVEQDLNLTQDEAYNLLALLRKEALPENRTYRYNYVKDNCATRILDRVDRSLSTKIAYPDSVKYGTFRNEMRAYAENYPWYQFGIDIALGSGIDYPLKGREEMFVPVELMEKADKGRLLDGRPLVKEKRVVFEGVADATLPPGSKWLTPLAVSIYLLIITCVVSFIDFWRKRLSRWYYAAWFLILGLAGCVVWFLVFVSTHEATSPNTLLLWLSPVQLVTAVTMALRRCRKAGIVMGWYNIVAMLSTLVVWPFQTQSGNPAFFPLMGVTLILAVTYTIIASKDSYKIGGKSSGISAASNNKAGGRKRKSRK